MTIVTNGQTILPGCVLESSRGIYATSAMVRIAHDLGFPLDEADHDSLCLYDEGGSWEADEDVIWLADKAEQWLNDHTTGGFWHWWDGDFRVDEECPNEWDECDDEECWQHSDY